MYRESRDLNYEGEVFTASVLGAVGPAEMSLALSAVAQKTNPKTKTVLVVEDEAFVLNVTAEVLKSAGYNVVTALNAAEALQLCSGRLEPIELLLTDVVLPGMSGRDLALEFEGLCPWSRVVLMTGYGEHIAWCESCTPHGKYLSKPFSAHTLLSKVREALEANVLDFRATGFTHI